MTGAILYFGGLAALATYILESAKKSGVKLPGADIAAQLGIGETTVYRILALHRAQRL